ncbi:cellulose-binding domain-containing protein [Streptomyces sp. NPDC006743]|uniref:cellulose-binding domain-containing protein n=1 Tax=Streptomyces sp. NPDC006743 TaxID=3154480 RepID=UPI00345130C9
MPDQPSPRDTAEAALLSECWDAVLSYADLCTAGSTAAGELAAEAFALGLREVRAADAGASRGRRTPRLPALPLMLTAVRTTAAAWEAAGLGDRLDPGLRLWLDSPRAARYCGPPLHRPPALRALRDLQEADAALLWLAEVEALPLVVVARRLGLDPARVSEELEQVRGLFRDRCRRDHLDTPMDPECRGYARLLDVVTRPAMPVETPEDLSRHLAACATCAEAAACLRLRADTLPAALAGGVIGWGGLAYLERRRRAADVRLGARGPAAGAADRDPRAEGAGRARLVRGGLLATAVALSALALAVSLMPFGGAASDAARDDADRRAVADPRAVPPPAGRPPAPARATASPSGRSAASGAAPGSGRHATGPQPQGTPSAAATGDASGPAATARGCRVRYDLVDRWPGGFQAAVTVTTAGALETWRIGWTFGDGPRITQMWDATVAQSGSRVTATSVAYNRSVAAGGTLSFGFIASGPAGPSGAGDAAGGGPCGFTLDGHACHLN